MNLKTLYTSYPAGSVEAQTAGIYKLVVFRLLEENKYITLKACRAYINTTGENMESNAFLNAYMQQIYVECLLEMHDAGRL
jgi:hypothetical protein